jgi:hypothetical protein
MPNLPLRQLGAVGVITDANPYDLPPNAFSAANNVIFYENRVIRAPVFKQLFTPIRSLLTYAAATTNYTQTTNAYIDAQGSPSAASRFIGSYADPSLGQTIFVCDNDGTVRGYPQGKLTFQTPSHGVLVPVAGTTNTGSATVETVSAPAPLPNTNTYKVTFAVSGSTTTYTVSVNGGTPGTAQTFTPTNPMTLATGITTSFLGAPGNGDTFTFTSQSGMVTNDKPWSHAQVSGMSFLARPGMIPYARNIATDSAYSLLGGDWPGNYTANVVRDFIGYCIMLGINKGGKDYPTCVKWDNPAQYSSSANGIFWDPANPNYLSGENIIGEMSSPIRDGLTLGNMFVIYGQSQIWLMEYTGDLSVFAFRRVPYTGGILNTNCAVEIEGKHYVFGDNDIYVHDGVSRQSLADGRVRRRIFNTLDRSKQTACFTLHDSVSKLVYFCYATRQEEATFYGTQFCNQAAIYNYKNDTWSFMDLPNIVGGTESLASLVADTYPQVNSSYSLYNSAYTAYNGDNQTIATMLGIYDQSHGLSTSNVFAVDLPTVGLVNLPADVEALKTAYVERIGIEIAQFGLPLRNYKTIKCVVPQCTFADTNGQFQFQFGSTDVPMGTPNYTASATFTPSVDYKMDMRVSGRYLAYKVSTKSISDFEFSGFDAEVMSLSSR